MLDKSLLDILVCPECKGPLQYQPERQELWCRACRLAYTIDDGIPVMLPEQARKLELEEIE